MITVAGFNTAIDHWMELDALRPGKVHRAAREEILPGGKGLHVAQTIAALGEPARLIGIVDAAHRDFIARRMDARGVHFQAVEIDAPLRHCMALREADGRSTEVLGPGPELGAHDAALLADAFRAALADSRLMVLSGSLPRGLGADTYAGFVRAARAAGRRCGVDTSGALLRQTLAAQPFLLKPNRDEAEALLGHPIPDVDTAVVALRELAARGVEWPALSLGAQGAVALDAGGAWHAAVALREVRNTVGSGDCFLAGMAVALVRGQPLPEALRLAVACGAANAMSVETGYVRRDAVDALLPRVTLRAWTS